jgi:hypothetical protein
LQRRILVAVAAIVGCVIAGGLTGAAVRWWIGGLEGQRDQLHRCVLSSERAHPNENPRTRLAHLQAEVPACMDAAGYATALDNKGCGRALWQGDAYCYVPKDEFGRLLFKIETLFRAA